MKSRIQILLLGMVVVTLLFGCAPSAEQPADRMINLTVIGNLTAPVTGATPVMSVDSNQFTGTVSWNPAVNGNFAVDTQYTATLTLTAKPGYTFAGLGTNAFTVSGATIATNAANTGVVTAVFPATKILTVTKTEIVGIFPVTGEVPVRYIDDSQYSGTVSWNPPVVGGYAPDTTYVATINLTPKNGYSFEGIPANTFRVNGLGTRHAANTGLITLQCVSTKAISLNGTVIGSNLTKGIISPVAGRVPLTAYEDSSYSVAIKWSPDATYGRVFDPITVYTATITVTPMKGYTLSGVAANGLSVDGAQSSTNAADSGVVTAVFPATGRRTITLLDIPGIRAPVVGAVPVTSVRTNQYTGTIQWMPAVDTYFAPNTAYTAYISLDGNDAWMQYGVPTDGFTVAGATARNTVNSGMVEATFPPTDDGSLTSATIGDLIHVPGGRFLVNDNAKCVVRVSPLRMSKHEITRAQFAAVMNGADPSDASVSGGADDPVQRVNFYQAVTFCNKLSLAEGLQPVYSVSGVDFSEIRFADIPTVSADTWKVVNIDRTKNGYRLPTDMEWKWAAMGAPENGQNGKVNQMGYLQAYSGSIEGSGTTNIASYCWYAANSAGTTHPVGGKTANRLGICDMGGNVREWCNDLTDAASGTYELLNGEDADSLIWSSGFKYRVLLGGSFEDAAESCGVVRKTAELSEVQNRGNGFRVVRR
jgi:formylglycine-generating enzyme required for sulfatase activity